MVYLKCQSSQARSFGPHFIISSPCSVSLKRLLPTSTDPGVKGITAGELQETAESTLTQTLFTGYHRLWSHRSYVASYPLQIFLILAGASAVQGSCYWWARRHRSHHRHTDTDLDPYNSERGLLWTHVGWVILDTDLRPGPADVSDLKSDPLVQWQHRWYFVILTFFGYVLPMCIPGLLYGDWRGGFYFVGALRMTACHHVCHSPRTNYRSDIYNRAHFASILLLTTLEAHRTMTNIPLATTSSLPSSRWAKGTTTFTISSQWIIGKKLRIPSSAIASPAFRSPGTPFAGGSTIRPSGSSPYASSLGLPPIFGYSLATRLRKVP